jgi:hypothetical protein
LLPSSDKLSDSILISKLAYYNCESKENDYIIHLII